MKRALWLLMLPLFLQGDILFNGSFELGCDGFACEKFLRTDTNPALTYLPLRTDAGAPGAGAQSLLIDNSFNESINMYSREFKLKPNTRYRLTGKMKADKPGYKVSFRVFKVDRRWWATRREIETSTQWSDFSTVIATQPKELEGNGWHHLRISFPGDDDAAGNRYWLDDLALVEEGQSADPQLIQATAVPSQNLYYDGEQAELTLKAFNPTTTVYRQTWDINVKDDYLGTELLHLKQQVALAPGETKIIPLGQHKLTRFGGFRVTVNGEKLNSYDSFFCVFGRYEQKPIDIRKHFAVGFCGGLGFKRPPNVKHDAYQVYNTSLEKRFELYAKAGVRIMRDHDGGVRGVDWTSVEWERDTFDFTHLDRQMKLYDQFGITLFPVIGNGFIENTQGWQSQCWPLWVMPMTHRVLENTPNCMTHVKGKILEPPKQLYHNYIYQVAKHLKGRVPVYEITNEPNLYLSPNSYVDYLKEAHDAIRKADPDAKISGFCLTSDHSAAATPWMAECAKLGGLKYVDMVGFHPYRGRELGSIHAADKYIADLRKEMSDYGRSDLELWNTELYYLIDQQVDHNSHAESLIFPHHIAWRFLVDLGENVVQSISIHENQVWKRMLTPNFEHGGANYHELIPSENLVTYNALARLFEGAKAERKLRHRHGAICYVYRKDGKLIAALWQYLKKTGVHADLTGLRVMDIFGNDLPAGEKLLGNAPYYVTAGKGMSEQAFLARLENLSLRLDQPVSCGEMGRLVNDTLHVMLHNDTNETQPCNVGLQGSGLTARNILSCTLPPNARLPLQIPVQFIAEETPADTATLMVYSGSNLFRLPLKLVRNELFGRQFKLENATGELAFGPQNIKLTMWVNDTTDAGPSGKRSPWQTDCVELFFDLNPTFIPITHAQAYTPQTFRLFVTPRDATKLHAQGDIKAEDCKLTVSQDARGYALELTIPAKAGHLLGFDVKIDDAADASDQVKEFQLGKGLKLYQNRCSFSLVK